MTFYPKERRIIMRLTLCKLYRKLSKDPRQFDSMKSSTSLSLNHIAITSIEKGNLLVNSHSDDPGLFYDR